MLVLQWLLECALKLQRRNNSGDWLQRIVLIKMITEYLGNHAEQIKDISEIKQSELYVVGRGAIHFKGFRIPRGDKNIKIINGERIELYDINVYEVELSEDGKSIVSEKTARCEKLVMDNVLDIKHMGVFRPSEGSRLRKTLEEHNI